MDVLAAEHVAKVAISQGHCWPTQPNRNRFNFTITGLPGSGTAFWSHALTTDTSFCYHEFKMVDADHKLAHVPRALGDSSSDYLLNPVNAPKRVLILRRPKDAMESFLRRFPSDRDKAEELFAEMEECVNHTANVKGIKMVAYEDSFSEATIRDVFTFCTGMGLSPLRAKTLARTNITIRE